MITSIKDSLKRNFILLIIGPAIKIIEAFFDLIIPLFMKAIIDLSFNQGHDKVTSIIVSVIKSLPKLNSNEIINYCLVGGIFILLMGIIGFSTTMVTQLLAAKCASNVGTDIRHALYEKALNLNKKEISDISINRIQIAINSDSFQVQQGVLFFIRLITRTPVIIFGSLLFSILLNLEIGLLFITLIPGVSFIIYFFMSKTSKQYLIIQEDLETLTSRVNDTIIGNKVIKVFNKELYENNKFKMNVDEYKKHVNIASKYNAFINPLTFSLVTIIIIFTLVISSTKSVNSTNVVIPSTLITLVAYLDQIFLTIIVFVNLMVILTRSFVSSKRINNILSINPSITDNNGFVKKIKSKEEYISFDNVTFKYFENSNPVIENITFKINKGESIGIIGPTGSGKSTLAYLIDSLIKPSSGIIKYKGINLDQYSLKTLREEISFVFQKSVLLNGTIKSNILLNNINATDNEINHVLKISLADKFVNNYKEKIDHIVFESGKNYSGGERQRLSIARGLIKNSELLILDDSTSALDLLSEKKIRENISKYYPKLTKIIISQRVSSVINCDKILVIDSGKQLGFGTHNELLKKSKVYKEIFESQNMENYYDKQ